MSAHDDIRWHPGVGASDPKDGGTLTPSKLLEEFGVCSCKRKDEILQHVSHSHTQLSPLFDLAHCLLFSNTFSKSNVSSWKPLAVQSLHPDPTPQSRPSSEQASSCSAPSPAHRSPSGRRRPFKRLMLCPNRNLMAAVQNFLYYPTS